MKKLLVLTIAAFLVMVVGSAFAAETTLSGTYEVKAWTEWNFDKKYDNLDDAQYDGWFQQQFTLTLTHTRSEFLKAVVKLDLVEDTWGMGRAMWINNRDNGEYIKQAYLDFTIPSIGHFRVGKFPIFWGQGLTFSTGSTGLEGIEYSNAWGMVALTALYAKAEDNIAEGPGVDYNRDLDLYALNLAITPAENHLIELFGGYANAPAYGAVSYVSTFDAAGDLVLVEWPDVDANLWFVGLAYTGNFADMIDVKAEFSYLFGDYKMNGTTLDGDIEGFNAYADVSYYNDLLRVGLAFLYRSALDLDEFPEEWNQTNLIDQGFAWANVIGNDAGGLNSVYGNAGYVFDGPEENIISAKLYFSICPVEKLTINAAVVWAKFVEDVGFGGMYWHPADLYGNHAIGYGWGDDDDLGWEIDLGFSYAIMEGLTYTFAGGVLFTGDAFDYDSNGAVAGGREDWGEIWSLSNSLLYEF